MCTLGKCCQLIGGYTPSSLPNVVKKWLLTAHVPCQPFLTSKLFVACCVVRRMSLHVILYRWGVGVWNSTSLLRCKRLLFDVCTAPSNSENSSFFTKFLLVAHCEGREVCVTQMRMQWVWKSSLNTICSIDTLPRQEACPQMFSCSFPVL